MAAPLSPQRPHMPLAMPTFVDPSTTIVPTLRGSTRPRLHGAPMPAVDPASGAPLRPLRAAPRALPAKRAPRPIPEHHRVLRGLWTVMPEWPEETPATTAGELRKRRAKRLGLPEAEAWRVQLCMRGVGPGMQPGTYNVRDETPTELIRIAVDPETHEPTPVLTRVWPPVIVSAPLDPACPPPSPAGSRDSSPARTESSASLAASFHSAGAADAEVDATPAAAEPASATADAPTSPLSSVPSHGTTPRGARVPSLSVEDCTTPERGPERATTEPAKARPGGSPNEEPPVALTSDAKHRAADAEEATPAQPASGPAAAKKKRKRNRRARTQSVPTESPRNAPSPAGSTPEGFASIVRELCQSAATYAAFKMMRGFVPRTSSTERACEVGGHATNLLGTLSRAAAGSSHVAALVAAVAIVEHAFTDTARREPQEIPRVVATLAERAVQAASNTVDDAHLSRVITALGSIVATVAASAVAAFADTDALRVVDGLRVQRTRLHQRATRMLRDSPTMGCAAVDATTNLCAAEAATRLLQCAVAIADPKPAQALDGAAFNTRPQCPVHAPRAKHLGAATFVAAVDAAIESAGPGPIGAGRLFDRAAAPSRHPHVQTAANLARSEALRAATTGWVPSLPGFSAALRVRLMATQRTGPDGRDDINVPWIDYPIRTLLTLHGPDAKSLAEADRMYQALETAVRAEIDNPTYPPSRCTNGPSIAGLAANAACLVLAAADVIASGRPAENPWKDIAFNAALRFRVAFAKLRSVPPFVDAECVAVASRMLLHAAQAAQVITDDSRVAWTEAMTRQLHQRFAFASQGLTLPDMMTEETADLVHTACVAVNYAREDADKNNRGRNDDDETSPSAPEPLVVQAASRGGSPCPPLAPVTRDVVPAKE